ncbi:MAG: glycoside hydrolase family 3 C-terminal domain-containing protein [Victivallaceae bacterium]|nr:glycoside hydrolase family 3 C-terminal domain-containing protein [Victivallaceae bacterium]
MKNDRELHEIVQSLTLEEKIGLVYGDGKTHNHGVPRLKLSALGLNNGPRGVRLEDGRTATCLPATVSLASTFDKQAAREYGKLIGEECLASGAQVLEGPGMNIQRSPLCGRNYEYLGEDPVLSGKIAAAYVEGCQSVGVAATPKHFALNNQETCRRVTSANVDERTMREFYLRNFEIVVRESRPWMMMCSYNRVNGIYASEHRHLALEILKGEWGFDGAIVSDWGAVHNAYQSCVHGGIDLEMSGGENARFYKPLTKLVRDGLLPESVLDEHVFRMLKLMDRTKCFEPEKRCAGSVNTPEHRKKCKLFAQQGAVLLKNDGILPLDKTKCKKIVVCGPSADLRHEMGHHNVCGGSGSVHPEYEITPLEGLREYLGPDAEILYTPGACFKQVNIPPGRLFRTDAGEEGLEAEFFSYDPATGKIGEKLPLRRIDTQLEQHFGHDNAFVGSNAPATPLDDIPFFARWRGSFLPENTGKCSFSLLHLDNCRVCLKIAGKTVLDSAGEAFRDYESAFSFDARNGEAVPVEIEFFRFSNKGQVSFRLLYDEKIPVDLEAVRAADAVLYFGGTSHATDREATGLPHLDTPADIPDFEMPANQNELIRLLVENNPKTIVTLIHGSIFSIEKWIDLVPGALSVWYPGQEGGRAIAEMLFGDAEPSGRLCAAWAKKLDDYPCHKFDLFPGIVDPYVAASEYLDRDRVGYRHFDTAGIDVRYPFGYGLSYTTFSYELVGVEISGRDALSRVKVTNTGKREGSAVVQMYLRDIESSVERPFHELADFAKIRLAPGESGIVELAATERDFSFFSEKADAFVFEPGKFELRFGTSSRDLFATETLDLR